MYSYCCHHYQLFSFKCSSKTSFALLCFKIFYPPRLTRFVVCRRQQVNVFNCVTNCAIRVSLVQSRSKSRDFVCKHLLVSIVTNDNQTGCGYYCCISNTEWFCECIIASGCVIVLWDFYFILLAPITCLMLMLQFMAARIAEGI